MSQNRHPGWLPLRLAAKAGGTDYEGMRRLVKHGLFTTRTFSMSPKAPKWVNEAEVKVFKTDGVEGVRRLQRERTELTTAGA